jgi:hypothetical protein
MGFPISLDGLTTLDVKPLISYNYKCGITTVMLLFSKLETQ